MCTADIIYSRYSFIKLRIARLNFSRAPFFFVLVSFFFNISFFLFIPHLCFVCLHSFIFQTSLLHVCKCNVTTVHFLCFSKISNNNSTGPSLLNHSTSNWGYREVGNILCGKLLSSSLHLSIVYFFVVFGTFPHFSSWKRGKQAVVWSKNERWREMGSILGWRQKLLFIALFKEKYQCKVVCDVKQVLLLGISNYSPFFQTSKIAIFEGEI